ncbi:MAG: Gfo/Idh/MocA family protein [Candidatus Dormibacteraceae bacterium]
MGIGWGIVGTGGHADKVMAPAITSVEGARLVGATSRDRSRAEDFVARHGGGRAWTDYGQMLADSEVEAVLITTPNRFHTEQIVAAARAGKHVLCDKPMAMNSAEAVCSIQECRRADVRLGVNFQMRHTAWAQWAQELIRSGALGDVLAIQAEQASGGVGFKGWRADPTLAGLGSVNNIGVHLFDLLRFLAGSEVTEVTAMFDTGRSGELEKLALTLLRFESGTLAYVNCNQAIVHRQNDIDIYGSAGRILGVNLSRHAQDGELRVTTAEGEKVIPESTHDSFRRSIEDFARAVAEHRDPLASGLDGLRSVEITGAIATSAREGRVVEVVRTAVA